MWRSLVLGISGPLDVFRTGVLVLANEVLLGVLAQPVAELGDLFTEAADRLLVHVGLADELGEGH